MLETKGIRVLSEPTSQARDARCLSVALAPETIEGP